MISQQKLRAVAYRRMSTDLQDTSIEIQDGICQRLADEYNCKIVREYTDEGISGDIESRQDFERLMHDVDHRNDFDVILCMDQDRFSRFDPMKANKYWDRLEEANITIITDTEGELDFSELSGWLVATINQYSRHQYLPVLSAKVLPGMLRTAREGKYTGGVVLLGFQITDEGYYEEDPETSWIIERVFSEFLAGTGPSAIARKLNDEGVKSSNKEKRSLWSHKRVVDVLSNVFYKGDYLYGRLPSGKYTQFIGGGETKIDKRTRRQLTTKKERIRPRKNEVEDCVYLPNNHYAIIEPVDFEKVQKKLKEKKGRRTPKRFMLSGMLRCTCGSKMKGKTQAKCYECGSRSKETTVSDECRFQVSALDVEQCVVKLVKDSVTGPAAIEAFKASMKKHLEKQRGQSDNNLDKLTSRLTKKESELEKAEDAAFEAPEDMKSVYYKRIRKLRDSIDELASEIDVQKRFTNVTGKSIKTEIKTAVEKLQRLDTLLMSSDPLEVRKVLDEIIDQIDVETAEVIEDTFTNAITAVILNADEPVPMKELYSQLSDAGYGEDGDKDKKPHQTKLYSHLSSTLSKFFTKTDKGWSTDRTELATIRKVSKVRIYFKSGGFSEFFTQYHSEQLVGLFPKMVVGEVF